MTTRFQRVLLVAALAMTAGCGPGDADDVGQGRTVALPPAPQTTTETGPTQTSATSHPKVVVEDEYPVFSSFADLAAAGTDVVIAVPGDTIASEVDRGLEDSGEVQETGEDPLGVPMAFMAAEVQKNFLGTEGADGEIVVAVFDDSKVTIGFVPLSDGTPTLFFLACYGPGETAISVVERFCVPVGGNAGVVDIAGNSYVSRGMETTTVGPAGPRGKLGPKVADAAELEQLLEALE